MNADLERLIALQKLDTTAHDAEHRLATESDRLTALEARLEAARQQVASAKQHLADNQNAWVLAADGGYHRVTVKGRARPFSSQQHLLERMAERIESDT